VIVECIRHRVPEDDADSFELNDAPKEGAHADIRV
jgi:hypothetical protein